VQQKTTDRCSDCHYWYPLDIMPRLGECHSHRSRYFEKPVAHDRIMKGCFKVRSAKSEEEFMWCGTCLQTIHVAERNLHRSHNVFAGWAQFPTEDMREVTFAG